jgi:signal transduction histidine kinase
MFRSVRRRLLLNSLLVSLAAIVAVGVATLLLVERHFEQQERQYLEERAGRFVQPIADALMWGDTAMVRQVTTFALLTSQVRVRVVDAEGNPLADSGSPADLQLGEPLLQGALPAAALQFYVDEQGLVRSVIPGPPAAEVGSLEGQPAGQMPGLELLPPALGVRPAPPVSEPSDTQVRLPVYVDDRLVAYVEASEGPAFGQVIIDSIRRALLAGSALALALAVGVGLVSAQQVSQPLQSLGTAVDQMAGGNLRVQAPQSGLHEFDRLAGQFNEMAGRLSQTIAELAADRAALRRLIADASHELRTPLTALKTFNELILQEALDEPNATFVRESQRQLAQLDRLTGDLLDLSRLEARLSGTDLALADLRPAVAGAVQRLRPLALARRQNLALQLPEQAAAVAHDAAAMERAVGNLVHNAIKYTPAGGEVRVCLRGEGEGVVVEVADNGVGIPAAEQPFIFERFYRGRGQKGDGSGLGLSISQEIAIIHGGRLSFESREGEGSTFRLWLPGEGETKRGGENE